MNRRRGRRFSLDGVVCCRREAGRRLLLEDGLAEWGIGRYFGE